MKLLWDALARAHSQGAYSSASAIAEGGVILRLFEAAYGSGLGARINLDGILEGRVDGLLFGEFIGSALLEVSPECDLRRLFGGVPHFTLGEIVEDSKLILSKQGSPVWEAAVSSLAADWSSTFGEVVK